MIQQLQRGSICIFYSKLHVQTWWFLSYGSQKGSKWVKMVKSWCKTWNPIEFPNYGLCNSFQFQIFNLTLQVHFSVLSWEEWTPFVENGSCSKFFLSELFTDSAIQFNFKYSILLIQITLLAKRKVVSYVTEYSCIIYANIFIYLNCVSSLNVAHSIVYFLL